MTDRKLAGALLSAGILASSTAWAQPNPVEMVDALNGVFGNHAGVRASHAKGVCVQGHFLPSAQALDVTHGTLWQAQQTPLTGRFSVGGGNPKASDKGKTVRGLALNIGEQWHLVGISAPAFMVATPEEFIQFMAARLPDPATGKPDGEKVKAFNGRTPSARAQIEYLEKTPVPVAYTQTQYWGVNAFRFTNAKNIQQYGRWRLDPQDGTKGLSPDELNALSDDFLQDRLKTRLADGPVKFNLQLQLALPGDNTKDPSTIWSSNNPQVSLGEVVLTGLGGDCANTMFNPAQLPAPGIGLSEDPTLLVRASAYAISFGRRLVGQ
jgi:catalase